MLFRQLPGRPLRRVFGKLFVNFLPETVRDGRYGMEVWVEWKRLSPRKVDSNASVPVRSLSRAYLDVVPCYESDSRYQHGQK